MTALNTLVVPQCTALRTVHDIQVRPLGALRLGSGDLSIMTLAEVRRVGGTPAPCAQRPMTCGAMLQLLGMLGGDGS